jgi:hypothetical protein
MGKWRYGFTVLDFGARWGSFFPLFFGWNGTEFTNTKAITDLLFSLW